MDSSNNALLYPGAGAVLRKVSGSTGNVVSEIFVIPNGGYSEIFSGNDCIEWELRFVFGAAATGSVVVEECADRSASAGGETLATVTLVAKLTGRYISGGLRTGYFRIHNSSGQDVTLYLQKRISSADYEVRIGSLETSSTDYGTRIDDLETGKEDVANKSTDIAADTGSDTKYPSVAAVEDALADKQDVLVSGTSLKTVGGVSLLGSGNVAAGGVSEDTINDLPAANSFDPGDKLLLLKGTVRRVVQGTCAGLSSDPNETIIGNLSVVVDPDLNAVDFAAAIVAEADTPTNLAAIPAVAITDNLDGTFDVECDPPGLDANDLIFSGTDDNPSFADLTAGAAELEKVDQTEVVGGTTIGLFNTVYDVNLNDQTGVEFTPVFTCPSGKIAVPTAVFLRDITGSHDSNPWVKVTWNNSGRTVTNSVDLTTLDVGDGFIDRMVPIPIANPSTGEAGDILGVENPNPQGSALTATVDVFGYLLDA